MSKSNLGSDELPETIDFEQAFKGVSAAIIAQRHPVLDHVNYSPREDWDNRFDPDDVRLELSFSIEGALDALNVPQPEGDDLDWLGDLHDLVLEDRPGLAKYLEATTDQGREG